MKEPKHIRVRLKHGSARVAENCSKETIDMLNKMVELAYNMKEEDLIKLKEAKK